MYNTYALSLYIPKGSIASGVIFPISIKRLDCKEAKEPKELIQHFMTVKMSKLEYNKLSYEDIVLWLNWNNGNYDWYSIILDDGMTVQFIGDEIRYGKPDNLGRMCSINE